MVDLSLVVFVGVDTCLLCMCTTWWQVLDDLELSEVQEVSVLEFCCEVSSMPYNRRTSRSLRDIIRYITIYIGEPSK